MTRRWRKVVIIGNCVLLSHKKIGQGSAKSNENIVRVRGSERAIKKKNGYEYNLVKDTMNTENTCTRV